MPSVSPRQNRLCIRRALSIRRRVATGVARWRSWLACLRLFSCCRDLPCFLHGMKSHSFSSRRPCSIMSIAKR